MIERADRVPYMFQFAPPREGSTIPVTDTESQKETTKAAPVRWMVNRVNEPTSYLCLRAKLSQALFNPVTMICMVLAVLVHVFYLLLSSGIGAAEKFDMYTCQVSNSLASGDMQSQQLAAAIYSTLNQSMQATLTQTFNSLNASIWNMRQMSLQYANLTSSFYHGISATLPSTAQKAVTNATDVLDAYLQPKLNLAKNTSAQLVQALTNVGSALSDSGVFGSMNTNNLSSIFDISVPDISSPYSALGSLNQTQWVAIAYEKIDAVVADTTTAFAGLQTNVSSLNANSSFAPTKLVCSSVTQRYGTIKDSIGLPHRVFVSILSILTVLFIALAGIYYYFAWQHTLRVSKYLEYPEGSVDSIEFIQDGSSYGTIRFANALSGRFKSKTAQIYSRWWVAYIFSGVLGHVLLLGICLLIFGAAQSTMVGSAYDASHEFWYMTVNGSTNSTTAATAWVQNVNTDLLNSEKQVNLAAQTILTDIVTKVSTIFGELYANITSDLTTTWAEANVTFPALNITSTFLTSGYAMEHILFPRLDPNLLTDTSISEPAISQSGDPFSMPQVLLMFGQSVRATCWLSIGTLLLWILLALVAMAYAFTMAKYLPARG